MKGLSARLPVMKKVKITITKRPSRIPGRAYLYLEYSPCLYNPLTGKETARESLKKYVILNPATEEDREFNEQMMNYARKIRNLKARRIANRELHIFDECVNSMDFLEYYKDRIKERNSSWEYSYKHLYRFKKGKIRFGDVNYRFGESYRRYLMDVAVVQGVAKRKGKARIHQNTASKYFQHFRSIVHDAFIENYLKEDYSLHWRKVPLKRSQREFLTNEEVKRLFATPCEYEVLRNAAAFSIFSGLRLGDILTLEWSHLIVDHAGQPYVRKVMCKTGNLETIAVSREALDYCGPRRDKGLVFREFRRTMTVKPLRDWVAAAGIEKNITFYSFRHTCATMLISAGVDINTVSRHMTHSSIVTTQQYFHLVNEKSREAAELIKLA